MEALKVKQYNERFTESLSLQAFANKHASVSLECLTVNRGITFMYKKRRREKRNDSGQNIEDKSDFGNSSGMRRHC